MLNNILIMMMLEQKRYKKRNNLLNKERQYFNYERQNDPVSLINDGISVNRFVRMFRLSPQGYLYVLTALKPYFNCIKSHVGRNRILDSTRLGIYLVFVGRDPDYFNVGLVFGVSESSVKRIVEEVNRGILLVFNNIVQVPNTVEQLEEKAHEFEQLHENQFNNCIGAIDGVHIPIGITDKTTYTSYYNHKGFYSFNSIVLVDARCKILAADLGFPGCRHDSYCFDMGTIKSFVESLPNRFMVVADAGFALTSKLLIPFDKNELLVNEEHRGPFNVKLSQCRVRTEMAFGMIKKRFRMLRTPVEIDKETHIKITMAIFILHNLCIDLST